MCGCGWPIYRLLITLACAHDVNGNKSGSGKGGGEEKEEKEEKEERKEERQKKKRVGLSGRTARVQLIRIPK